jgi:hypothetical protein
VSVNQSPYPNYTSRDDASLGLGALLEPNGKSAARRQNLATPQDLSGVRFEVVKLQVRSSGSAINPSAASEVAFQSCQTEEQALFAHASAGGVSQAQANQVITDYNGSAPTNSIKSCLVSRIQVNAKGAELGPVLETIENALRADQAKMIEAE